MSARYVAYWLGWLCELCSWFEDGAGWQEEPTEFEQDGCDVLWHIGCSSGVPVLSLGGHGAGHCHHRAIRAYKGKNNCSEVSFWKKEFHFL